MTAAPDRGRGGHSGRAVEYEGRCHCGAIGWLYATELPPRQWQVRACQCSFCRSHRARCTSDPEGSLRFLIRDPEQVSRHRFALGTADFLVCRRCGAYAGAVLEADGRSFGIVNLDLLASPVDALPAARPTSYDSESVDDRVGRRQKRWTPVTAAS